MPNKNTPAKHRTPNWKLVNIVSGPHHNRFLLGIWQSVPLRKTRKDLITLS